MTPADVVRRPRIRLSINGTVVDGCVEAEISAARGSVASTFSIEVSSNIALMVLGNGWMDGDTLDVAIDITFAVAAGESPQGWTRMISGPVDRITAEPLSGVIILEGRDNAGKLIDLPLEDGYLNRTASEVVQDLGARCGLTVDADQTTGLIGQYYQIQHSKTVFGAYSKHANGWDLLSELAQIQDFELWVDGDTLHFGAMQSDDDPFVVSVNGSGVDGLISCSGMSTMSLQRTIGVSGPVQVSVASWNSRQKKAINASYPADADDASKIFRILKPNLLPDQAQALAASTYAQLRARQRVLTGSMPGELTLTPRRVIQLNGTGTDWDTRYVIDKVSRHLSTTHGYTQHVTALTLQDGT